MVKPTRTGVNNFSYKTTMTDPDKPPLFKSWTGWYVLILSVLVLQIITYYVLTITYA